MKHQLFKTKFQFWEFFDGFVEGLDLDQTLRVPYLWFVDEEGETYKCGHMKEFVQTFNKRFYTNLCDKHSYKLKSACVVFFKEEEEKEDIVEVTEDQEILVSLDAVEDDTPDKVVVKEPDWDWINSLKSTQDDKKRLDDYALKHYDIELRRNKKLKDMVKDFKEALGIKE